jgi:hypothetical protein
MRSLAFAVLASAVVVPSVLQAQIPERGGFIVRLGVDTVAVERFSRTPTQLEGDVVSRSPRTAIVHYVATLAPSGRITRYEASTHAGGQGLAGPAMMSTVAQCQDARDRPPDRIAGRQRHDGASHG